MFLHSFETDDEPEDDDSPKHYVIIHDFPNASTLQDLSNIGVNVNALIKLQLDEYQNVPASDDVNAEDNEVVNESSKDEEELKRFWEESDQLVHNAPTGHKLKDIAKYEVTVSNKLLPSQDIDEIDEERKVFVISLNI